MKEAGERETVVSRRFDIDKVFLRITMERCYSGTDFIEDNNADLVKRVMDEIFARLFALESGATYPTSRISPPHIRCCG
ncbi:MAG: hypothetical protein LBK46_10000 [Oscillospiraceae bacterium]|nr:hypothetical protein [Oscillospiraceae bacterium]